MTIATHNHPVGRLQFHTFDNPVGAERSDEQFSPGRSMDWWWLLLICTMS